MQQFYYKMPCSLQNEMLIAKCDVHYKMRCLLQNAALQCSHNSTDSERKNIISGKAFFQRRIRI